MKKTKPAPRVKSKINIFEVDPQDLTIVGLDTEDGPEHPRVGGESGLVRVKLPVSDQLIRSIQRRWFGTVAAVENGDRLEIVFGRQRTKAARVVNTRLAEAGRPPIKILVQVVPAGDEHLLSDITISENECRQDDDAYTKALKTRDYMKGDALGPRTIEEAAIAFGCSEATVKSRLETLTLSPKLQEAVAEGLPIANALALKSLTPEAQDAAAVVKMKAREKGKRAPRVPGESATPSTKPTKRAVKGLAQALGGVHQLSLLWAIGEIDKGACTENPQIAEAFKKAGL